MKSREYFKKFSGICNVEDNYDFYSAWLLSKVNELFDWENLPDTIDETVLNTYLFLDGKAVFTKINDKLYALDGNYGGKPNQYYLPTEIVIANPILGSHNLKIDKDCVVMYNTDTDKIFPCGLKQLIHQTATLLADNIVSINCAQLNTRVQSLVVADSTIQKNSAELVMKDLYSGKPYKVLEDNMIDKIKVNNIGATNSSQTIQQLIELHQYIIGQFFNNIGIKTNFVMKKERLITDEINCLDDFLAISLDTMLISRQNAVEKINKLYGTNIKVKLKDYLEPLKQREETPKEEENSSSKEENSNSKETSSSNLETETSESQEGDKE